MSVSATSEVNRTREEALSALLTRAGWSEAERKPLAGDASTRRYERLTRGVDRAVLMDAPPGAEAASCPPGASAEERKALGGDIRETYSEAKAVGFDPKIMRQLVKLRQLDTSELQEQEALLDTYKHALGME